MTDLCDPEVRSAVTHRLGELWAGRPVVFGPFVLAGATSHVEWFRDLGCPVLVVATGRGAGPVPPEGHCEVVTVTPPPTISMTAEMRAHDRLAHHLPGEARAAIDAFDPERRGVWFATPFVTTDEPIDGRPGNMLPVVICRIAGSWLIASVCSDFSTQSSSAMRAVYGKSSDIQWPDLPCCANL